MTDPSVRPPKPADPGGMRTTILSAAIMIGVVLGANVVNAAVPLPSGTGEVDPGPAAPVDPDQPTREPGRPQATVPPIVPGPLEPGTALGIGAGVVIFPPDGWTVVAAENGVTMLQKGGVVMIVAGVAWGGTPLELVKAYRDSWSEGIQLTTSDPEPRPIGPGVPGAAMSWSGVLDGTRAEGVIVSGVAGGAGVVFNVFGATGSLNGVSSDIDAIFGTVQFTGDPG